jgi:N-acetylglucosamine-6-sulfatase
MAVVGMTRQHGQIAWNGPVFRRPQRPRGRGLALIALVAVLLGAATAVLTHRPGGEAGRAAAHRPAAGGQRGESPASHAPAGLRTAANRPNIVFVLTDDLSMDLLPYMPQVQALQAQGMTFANYFVSDSLCCPSRSSIFTGNFPHDTGVFTNSGPDGGIQAFFNNNDENATFNLALQRAGYRTAMMGKYLNGYLQGPDRSPVPSTYVPPGWDEWDVAGWGYREFNYRLNINGTLHRFGHAGRDYLTDVIARRGVRFIDRSATAGKPFFLELATFSPHTPYTPAPRYRQDFSGLQAPRPPSFDVLPTDAPSWLATRPPLTGDQVQGIDQAFRRRVQAVQAVDDLISRVRTALDRHGLSANTYIVFSSDNGLHTGAYRLTPGKLTAFDTDIHVPLVIQGPGVPAGQSSDAMAQNVDLAKTFTAIGGTNLPSDGHDLLALAHGQTTVDWRNAVLVEHHGPAGAADTADPDAQDRSSGNPPTYEAMRTPRFLYVEYADDEREFYDLQSDPNELHNLAAGLSLDQLQQLHSELAALQTCHDGPACWAAGHVPPLP